jgi:peptidase M23-like protein
LKSHRTTARATLFLLLLGVLAGSAQAASVPAVTAFPVVGNDSYIDDFGAPRPQGRHEGNDIMAIRHQPAVAFERGRVEKHVGSSMGTCMLYLHGVSGMTYVYIHLNNDLTMKNDNRGGCRNGVSWAPGLRNGQTVRRGQLVGYVGDSGDANGIQPHLHFEVRTPSGRAINPFTYLNRATRLLYPRPAAADPIRLILSRARLVSVGAGTVTVRTRRIRVSSQSAAYARRRQVVLTLPLEAIVERITSTGRVAAILAGVSPGTVVRVGTSSFAPSWATQGAPAALLSVGYVTIY